MVLARICKERKMPPQEPIRALAKPLHFAAAASRWLTAKNNSL